MEFSLSKVSSFLFRRRIHISFFVASVLLIDNLFIEKNVPYDVFSYPGILGSLMVVLGVLLRAWASGIIFKNKVLAVSGPYAITKHPLYLGSFLIASGFCFILNNLNNFIVVLIFMLFIYLPKMREEEKKLSEIFKDDWYNYEKNMNRFLPNFSKINSSWSIKVFLKNKEHYTFVGSLLGLLFLKIWSKFICGA